MNNSNKLISIFNQIEDPKNQLHNLITDFQFIEKKMNGKIQKI